MSDVDGRYMDTNFEIKQLAGGQRPAISPSSTPQAYHSTFSLWDTFRAAHPLYTLIAPDIAAQFVRDMVLHHETYGYLPIWDLWGQDNYCMIGNHAIPVLADAILAELPGVDVEAAYRAMVESSTRSHPNSPFEVWEHYGYMPQTLQNTSVSITLEQAFDDACVAAVAKKLGRQEDYERFHRRSLFYRNLFDPATGFFRPKDEKGQWLADFDPLSYEQPCFVEGNAWQYMWFVPHDPEGLISLFGSQEAFLKKLDENFSLTATSGEVNGNASGFIGQYAHGNEPSHHTVYLYNFAGRPERTQELVEQVRSSFYRATPCGYAGNDDCGQMSAWYVLAALGRYPVTPGYGGISPEPPAALKPRTNGGLTRIPKTIVTNPAFEMENDIFADSLRVSISGEGDIYWRIGDGAFRPYEGPFTLYEPCRMEAYAQIGDRRSFTTRSEVHQIRRDRAIDIHSRYSRQYTAGGNEGLIDGFRGGLNWRTGGWQGYQDTDFEAVVDLLSERELSRVGAGFCQDARSWIWMPTYVEFSASSDGRTFTPLARIENTMDERDYEIRIWNCEVPVSTRARYVKVFAKNIGTIPDWHPGAGSPGFIFIDEIWAE